jgi:hypothetical protein
VAAGAVFALLVVAVLLHLGSPVSPAPPSLQPLPPSSTPTPEPKVTLAPSPPPEAGCPQGCLSPKPECAIKGNISFRNGERIYHLPNQRYYNKTIITPEKGERWFCTEAEAQANGWRKSRW